MHDRELGGWIIEDHQLGLYHLSIGGPSGEFHFHGPLEAIEALARELLESVDALRDEHK